MYFGPEPMLSSSPLSRRGRYYVACVVIAGTVAIIDSVYRLYSSPVSNTWLVLALLTLFSGSFAIKVPSIPATISVSETFVFTAVLLFGGAPATLIVALDGLIISLWRKKRDVYRIVFNGAEPAISIWIACQLFHLVYGSPPGTNAVTLIAPLILPLLVFTVVYFLLNSWLTAIAVWLETGIPAAKLWRQHFLWLSLNYFGGASVAILLARNTPGVASVDYSALSLIVPLLVISYLTFKTALQRVEDARSHVTELNKLYLSTIETFAMWIDAKDQVTHGHIRRVQTYAVELARSIGVKDEKLIKALEAAALLHDMGKLAVPEHILNKPGKLTPGEFEKMKLHASVGAQILSAIDFPYPVVPIVRHHHENWDGSGYPDGLSGTDIPIGARILAVVDCFDALTSDRPYRPKLSDDEAESILLERRGSMYDPLIVDAFIHVHGVLGHETEDLEQARAPQAPLLMSRRTEATDAVGENSESVLALYDLARSLAGHAGLVDTAAVILKHLAELLPARVCVLFLYEPERDELVASHATGLDSLVGMRIGTGVGISGWVAANRRIMTDADARLELSKLSTGSPSELRRAHSGPLLVGNSLLGVVTLYSSDDKPLSQDRVRTLQLLLPHISTAVQKAIEVDNQRSQQLHDRLTGLPKFATAAQLITGPNAPAETSHPLLIVFMDVDHLKTINKAYGTDVGDRVLMHVSEIARASLRSGDLLFRYDGDEFVVLLREADVSSAEAVARRLVETLSASWFCVPDGRRLCVEVKTGYALAPADGSSLDDLVAVAKRRAAHQTSYLDGTAVH